MEKEKAQLKELQKSISTLQKEEKHLIDNINKLRIEIETTKQEKQRIVEESQEARELLTSLVSSVSFHKEKLGDVIYDTKSAITVMQGEINDAVSSVVSKLNTVYVYAIQEIQFITTNIKSLITSIDSYKTELSDIKRNVELLNPILDSLEMRVSEKRQEIINLDVILHKLTNDIVKKQKERSALDDEITKKRSKLSELVRAEQKQRERVRNIIEAEKLSERNKMMQL